LWNDAPCRGPHRFVSRWRIPERFAPFFLDSFWVVAGRRSAARLVDAGQSATQDLARRHLADRPLPVHPVRGYPLLMFMSGAGHRGGYRGPAEAPRDPPRIPGCFSSTAPTSTFRTPARSPHGCWTRPSSSCTASGGHPRRLGRASWSGCITAESQHAECAILVATWRDAAIARMDGGGSPSPIRPHSGRTPAGGHDASRHRHSASSRPGIDPTARGYPLAVVSAMQALVYEAQPNPGVRCGNSFVTPARAAGDRVRKRQPTGASNPVIPNAPHPS
jgi:hypothetical protein